MCLNFSKADLATQLHFALFDGGGGYVLKPSEMRADPVEVEHSQVEQGQDPTTDDFWPPLRMKLHRATIEILSLHSCPKYREQRPRYGGSHGESHKYHTELSGPFAPPNRQEPLTPGLAFALYPIGGFCAVSKTLPLAPQNVTTELTLPHKDNGMNATFGEVVHCLAAEPNATVLRVSVTWRGEDIAFTTAMLGRLRRGYRILQLRSLFGTRIELAYLFVHVSFGAEPNLWVSPRQLRLQRSTAVSELKILQSQVATLDEGLAERLAQFMPTMG